MDISTLRKMRGQDFSKIATAFEKIANPTQGYKDDRFWKPEQDKAGNASAVIRFLPNSNPDDLPWAKVFNHGFQGPTGRWYIEDSLTTIGLNDYVGEQNSKLYNSGTEEGKKIAQKQKRKLSYICNVLIISDPKHPENNGQVRLFKFGKKIFDKIMDKGQPTFEDEKPVNVFDVFAGADFKLRMVKKDGFPNYDSSVFSEPTEMCDGDETEILAVMNKLNNLSDFTNPAKFKSYDELKAKYLAVMSGDTSGSSDTKDAPASKPAPEAKSKPAPAVKVTETDATSDDDEDSLEYFKRLAEAD